MTQDKPEINKIDLSKAPHIENVEMLDFLGRGGMSIVYKARQISLSRIVAVKILSGSHKDDDAAIKRFQQEAKLSSSLDHPNIAKTFGFGVTSDGQPYLLMEYIEGISLAEEIEKTAPIKYGRFKEIFNSLLSALGYAHSKGILHRDIKPGNVMICKSEDGQDIIKLLDFGIAKMLDNDSTNVRGGLTHTGTVLGSPSYMSPEQCGGGPLDRRSDLYSLSCVMYQSLCNELPFKGESSLDVMHKHVTATLPSTKELVRSMEVPQALIQLILRGLSKDPSKRPQSAEDFAKTLNKVINEITLDRAPRAHGIYKRRSTRNIYLAGVTMSLLAVAGIYGLVLLQSQQSANREVAKTMSTESTRLSKQLNRVLIRHKRHTDWFRAQLAKADLKADPKQVAKDLCDSLISEGNTQTDLGMFDAADNNFSEALALAKAKFDKDSVLQNTELEGVLSSRSRSRALSGKLDQAREDMDIAQALASRLWAPQMVEYQNLEMQNATLALQQGQLEKAAESLEEVQKWSHDLNTLAKAELININNGTTKLELAIEMLETLKKTKPKTPNDFMAKARSLLALASLFRNVSDYGRVEPSLILCKETLKNVPKETPRLAELTSKLETAWEKHFGYKLDAPQPTR